MSTNGNPKRARQTTGSPYCGKAEKVWHELGALVKPKKAEPARKEEDAA